MKEKVKAYIESIKDELITLSHNIHANPEIAFTEYKSSAFIVDVLKNHGFEVEYPYAGVETAFKATKKGKADGPKIAILAEYDALPEIGHACGHNVIATCSTGAFLAVSEILDNYDGEVSIIGTPAEEAGGGKIHILNNGGFDGFEYALMMHPSSGKKGLVNRGGRAATSVTVEFFGKAVHSSAPAHGINALNAMIKLFNNIDMMRPTFHPQNNVNGIIVNGGSAANAIPDYTKALFSLRAETLIELKKLAECVKKCAANAADFVGAKFEVHVGDMYAERYPNLPMCLAFKDNCEELGMPMDVAKPGGMYGSSDIGNVSIKMPAIHDYIPLCDDGIPSHNRAYTEQTDKPRADEICLLGAKAIAMTVIDILEKPEFRKEIYKYLNEQIPEEYKG